MNIYWGETHDNVCQFPEWPLTIAENVALARQHLDFYAPALYTAAHTEVDAVDDGPGRIAVETWKTPDLLSRQWQAVQDATHAANAPGTFVTFPGYEWQGDGRWGDHNVVHRREGAPLARVDTLPELYAALAGAEAIAIPHHTAYIAANRGRDWALVDEVLTPFAELYSVHGSSETDDECARLRANPRMGPAVSGGTYQDALDQGRHLGAIASTDGCGMFPGHYNWGVMACLAPELTRDALWDAFRRRRVYGVSGDRIRLDFRVNDGCMGDGIAADGPRRLAVAVTGLDALDRIEILRNGRVIHSHSHQGAWAVPAGRTTWQLRVEAGWGPMARDVGERPPRTWHGRLVLGDDARFVDWSPCWVSPGQDRPTLRGNVADFGFRTPQPHPGELALSPTQNATVFTVAATPDTPVALELDDLHWTGTLAGLAAGSHILWDDAGSRRLLADRFGIDMATFERPTLNYLYAHKVKLHRAVPEAACTATVEFLDDAPLTREVNYRVRVLQRNGQQAWSSPIWVRPLSPASPRRP